VFCKSIVSSCGGLFHTFYSFSAVMDINTFVLVFLIYQANVYVLVVDLMHRVCGKSFMNIYVHKQEYMKNII
jgi:hypothetical protein